MFPVAVMLLTPVTSLGRLIHNVCELDVIKANWAAGFWVGVFTPKLNVPVLTCR